MASRYYCSNVAGELEYWSRRLHKLSSGIDSIPSIDKYRLQPQIDELHIIMTELDDRLCELMMSCENVEGVDSMEATEHKGFDEVPFRGTKEHFDYDFGG
ncbi:MAG: hypothetical protein Kow0089_14110 [Desulfobulbaceae bacterium]